MPEELIDLLLPDGTPIGRAKPKSQVHRDGDLHRTVHLWIVTPDGRLLLQLRASTKVNHPSLWDVSVAGHVDAGERPEAAAIREAREELGIEIAESELAHLGSIRERWVIEAQGYFDNEIQEIYLVRRDVDRSELALQASEVDDAELVAIDDFRRDVETRAARLVGHWPEYELLLDELG
jgi:isopentenyldiphosphate isomerase